MVFQSRKKTKDADLYTNIKQWREAVKIRNAYIPDSVDFVRKYRILKGSPFDLSDRDYLLDIYKSIELGMSGKGQKRIIIKKCVQSEFTETMVNVILWLALKYPHITIIYTSPRDDQVRRVSNERIWGDAIQASPSINSRVVERNVHTIKFDNGSVVYLYSAWKDADALRNIPADVVVADEIQDLSEASFGVLESRMDHSKYGLFIVLGSPKLEGTEFQKLWKLSTRNEWAVTCPKCGREQVLEFNNIQQDGDDRFFRCIEGKTVSKGRDENGNELTDYVYTCKTDLYRGSGRWLPYGDPKSLWQGFHISQYMVPWKTAQELWDRKTYYRKPQFVNEIEGDFYSGEAKPITLVDIMRNIDKHNGRDIGMAKGSVAPTALVTDWMNYPVVMIVQYVPVKGDPIGLRRILFVKSWDGVSTDDEVYMPEIEKMVEQYNVNRIVNDMGYGMLQNKRLYRKFKSKLFGVWYGNPSVDKVKISADEETGMQVLSADKSYFSDLVVDNFKKDRYIIPYANPEAIDWAFSQWTAIEVEDVKNPSGKEYRRFVASEATPDDHAFQCLVYAEIAFSKLVKPLDLRANASAFWTGGQVQL